MSKIIKRDLTAIVTCPSMHEHGEGRVRLSYNVTNPLSFFVRTNLYARFEDGTPAIDKPVSYELYRESVFYWLAKAPGGSVHELGDISLKVRLTQPYIVCVRFPKIDEELAPGRRLKIRPMFMIGRDPLQRFLADTYAAFPAECEYDLLNVDRCLEQLLRPKKT